MEEKSIDPPKWADRFLSWYCNPKLLEQIQGDVHELFYWRLEERGLQQAKRSFVWDVVRLFRWKNIKRSSSQTQKLNNISMFKNYFKIGIRNLWKQRMATIINGLGLALAIACCLVAYQFAEKDFIVDKFHENKDQIHLVTPVQLLNGTPYGYALTRAHITNLIPDQVAGVESVIRYYSGFGSIAIGKKEFAEPISFVDPNFLQAFSFPVVTGDTKPLMERSEVVLSESFAAKLFGREYPIGKILTLNVRGVRQDFIVSAVIEDRGHETNMYVDVLVNYSSIPAMAETIGESTHTFVTIPADVSQEAVANGLAALIDQLPEDEAILYKTIRLTPFVSLMDSGMRLIGSFAYGINYEGIIIIGIIALFMLLLATFNYINIATVMAMSRVKEIGVRKVIGSNRRQLIFQFLTENFILCFLAIVIGFVLAKSFFLPWFNIVTEESFFLDFFGNPRITVFLVGLLFFLTIASGIYPAYVAARLQPTAIFGNASSKRSKRRLTGVLLTIQLSLALIAIVNALMFIYTEKYNKSSDWGFERSDRLAVANINKNNIDFLRNEIEQFSAVENVSSSRGGITGLSSFSSVVYNEKKSPVRVTYAEAGYAEVMGFRLQKGRLLDADRVEDRSRSIVVNSSFLRYTGVDSLNSKVMIEDEELTVVGVVDDYFYNGFASSVLPCMIRLGKEDTFNHFTIKVTAGESDRVEAKLINLFTELDGSKTTLTPMADVLDEYLLDSKHAQNMMVFCAIIAVFLAAMGIFGLVSLNISQNIKRFGIKKVLGAGIRHLYIDVYKPFGVICLMAFVLGGAGSVLLITPLLEMVHSYFPDFNISIILSGIALLMLVMALTVNTQVRKLVKLNPVDTLRNE